MSNRCQSRTLISSSARPNQTTSGHRSTRLLCYHRAQAFGRHTNHPDQTHHERYRHRRNRRGDAGGSERPELRHLRRRAPKLGRSITTMTITTPPPHHTAIRPPIRPSILPSIRPSPTPASYQRALSVYPSIRFRQSVRPSIRPSTPLSRNWADLSPSPR